MAGINRDGAAGTLAAMREAARSPGGGGGHDHPHEHGDLNEIVSDHAGHLDAHAGRLDGHDRLLADHADRLTQLHAAIRGDGHDGDA